MDLEVKNKQKPLLWIVWFLEGIFVGFGAILPGISGGTLCVAFGMYRPIIEALSDLKHALKNYGLMLFIFALGVGAGFVGLSGLAAMLLEQNTVLVTCVFIGFIIGTYPELWQDAGSQGRSKKSYIGMVVAFIVMLGVLSLLKTNLSISIAPNFAGYFLCGLLWGLSFIVPGLSSSSLLLFFGLYQPMLHGISTLDFSVLIPMGIGLVLCVLLLSKVIGLLYKKQFSLVSHCVLGIVVATTIMIFPSDIGSVSIALIIVCVVGGAIASIGFTKLCNHLKEKSER